MNDMTYAYPTDKAAMYKLAVKQLEAMTADEKLVTPNLANAAAILTAAMEGVNWIGFYLTRADELILGPYQGRPACIRIAMGKGVCGTAAAEDSVQLVPLVKNFPGYIACDASTQSEIVIPIHADGNVVAVLDIDSQYKNRFDTSDAEGLTAFVTVLEKNCAWRDYKIL